MGATALAGLTYGVTRRGFQRRAVSAAPASQTLTAHQTSAAPAVESPEIDAYWEALSAEGPRGSMPDPLDIAMSLDGVFDGQPEAEQALTARPSDHVPAPFGGDDEEAPSADDLGVAWLAQATQAEHSLRQSDLTPELENLALSDEAESADRETSDELDESLDSESDEHEDFRRTLT